MRQRLACGLQLISEQGTYSGDSPICTVASPSMYLHVYVFVLSRHDESSDPDLLSTSRPMYSNALDMSIEPGECNLQPKHMLFDFSVQRMRYGCLLSGPNFVRKLIQIWATRRPLSISYRQTQQGQQDDTHRSLIAIAGLSSFVDAHSCGSGNTEHCDLARPICTVPSIWLDPICFVPMRSPSKHTQRNPGSW